MVPTPRNLGCFGFGVEVGPGGVFIRRRHLRGAHAVVLNPAAPVNLAMRVAHDSARMDSIVELLVRVPMLPDALSAPKLNQATVE
ncbi:hypothetical protein J2W35_004147 [Variovorax boronicumulans]|nr:hypothetical protein [Variovorax boronicumulans]